MGVCVECLLEAMSRGAWWCLPHAGALACVVSRDCARVHARALAPL